MMLIFSILLVGLFSQGDGYKAKGRFMVERRVNPASEALFNSLAAGFKIKRFGLRMIIPGDLQRTG